MNLSGPKFVGTSQSRFTLTPGADGITLTTRSGGIALMNKVLAALMTLIIIGTVVVVFGLGFMSLM